MKRLFAALGLLLLLLAGSIYSGWRVEQMTNDCIGQLYQAQQMARADNWEQARSITKRVYQNWQEHGFALHALLRHQDTDQILMSFRAVEQYLMLEEMDQYAAANATLIVQLELLAEMEQASVENVL